MEYMYVTENQHCSCKTSLDARKAFPILEKPCTSGVHQKEGETAPTRTTKPINDFTGCDHTMSVPTLCIAGPFHALMYALEYQKHCLIQLQQGRIWYLVSTGFENVQ